MTSLQIRFALLISYFGDYCSLIGIMELAKKFGGNDKVVGIFVAYCVPTLIMAILANPWSARQKNPQRQILYFCIIGAIAAISLLQTTHYAHVVFITIVLGFVKEAIQLLINVFIKKHYSVESSKKVVNDITFIRYFIMVFGGSVGGYLGSIQRFDLVFTIDAMSFVIAGCTFAMLTNKHKQTHVEAVTAHVVSFKKMVELFSFVPLTWFMLCSIGIGAFMGLEYPLITTQLKISPKFMGYIYCGHVLGSVISRFATAKMLDALSHKWHLTISSMATIVAFCAVGLFGNHLLVISAQIGMLAFLKLSAEVVANYYLIKNTEESDFPKYNLYFRIATRMAVCIGAVLSLFVVKHFDLLTTNIAMNIMIFSLGLILSAFFSFSLRRKLHF